MSNLLLSDINQDNLFIIKRSDLEGRFDPSVYKRKFEFVSNIYENRRLWEVAFINPSVSFSSLDENTEISFIPMEAIDENNGVISKLSVKKIKESKGFTRFEEKDLIWAKITPCMQNGKSAIVRNTINGYACGSTEFFIIRPKTNNILVEYIHFILRDKRILNTAELYFGGSAGQQRVSKDFLTKLNIPLPPLNIQHKIVNLLNEANKNKQRKETEAKQLLDSINTYLLNELGITLPEKDNRLQSRIFITQFNDISGGRFDPDYNQSYYSYVLNKLSILYPTNKLRDISIDIFQGVGRNLTDNPLYTLLKVKNIKQGNDIDFEDVEYIDSVPYNKILRNNDILAPFIGEAIKQFKFSIFKEKKDLYTIDNNTGVIRIYQQNNNSNYVCEVLNCSIGKIQILKLIGGSGVPFLGANNVQNIIIPIPPLEKQNEIAEHIQAIRTQAKQLQKEGAVILEEAKKEVEKMILGE